MAHIKLLPPKSNEFDPTAALAIRLIFGFSSTALDA
jgi:hypothetical protein